MFLTGKSQDDDWMSVFIALGINTGARPIMHKEISAS